MTKCNLPVRRNGNIRAVILDAVAIQHAPDPRAHDAHRKYKRRINFDNEWQRLFDEVA